MGYWKKTREFKVTAALIKMTFEGLDFVEVIYFDSIAINLKTSRLSVWLNNFEYSRILYDV